MALDEIGKKNKSDGGDVQAPLVRGCGSTGSGAFCMWSHFTAILGASVSLPAHVTGQGTEAQRD